MLKPGAPAPLMIRVLLFAPSNPFRPGFSNGNIALEMTIVLLAGKLKLMDITAFEVLSLFA